MSHWIFHFTRDWFFFFWPLSWVSNLWSCCVKHRKHGTGKWRASQSRLNPRAHSWLLHECHCFSSSHWVIWRGSKQVDMDAQMTHVADRWHDLWHICVPLHRTLVRALKSGRWFEKKTTGNRQNTGYHVWRAWAPFQSECHHLSLDLFFYLYLYFSLYHTQLTWGSQHGLEDQDKWHY